MHSIPEPVSMPAAVGAIQWIDGFHAVHANLIDLLVVNLHLLPDNRLTRTGRH
jgi:hypothetical protein